MLCKIDQMSAFELLFVYYQVTADNLSNFAQRQRKITDRLPAREWCDEPDRQLLGCRQ
jgi:hypothetical protein